jgi:hypothetical protein
MDKPWNRKTRREMSRYGIGQKVLNEQYDVVRKTTQDNAYNYAFSAMLLALRQIHGFGYKRIHRIAKQTIININDSMCVSELVEQLKRETGFDVMKPILEDGAGMEVE